MLSTMQDGQLTITALVEHGRRMHAASEVVTCEGESARATRAFSVVLGDRSA